MRRSVLLPLLILLSLGHTEQVQPISRMLKMEELMTNTSHQWSNNLQKLFEEIQLKFSPPLVRSGVLCFIAASISSAGGIGGGGLFVPILTIVGGLELKTASTFSAFMVAGGSIANIFCTMFFNCIHGRKCVIDFDIALLSEPCLLLGVSIGVACNIIFPEWLITILFVAFLAWTTTKTCRKGVVSWRLESEEIRMGNENKVIKSLEEPLMGEVENIKISIPWTKVGILLVIWLSFFLLYVLRGDRDGQVWLLPSSIFTIFRIFFYNPGESDLPLSSTFVEHSSNGALWGGILDPLITTNSSCHNIYYLDVSVTEKRNFQPAGTSQPSPFVLYIYTF